VALAHDRLVFAQGWQFDREATTRFRLSLRWLVPARRKASGAADMPLARPA
jgi:hypothetical protein